MPLLQIIREPPKVRIITMGQADREVEYEEYYPPGATEPILREKQPRSNSEEPAVEQAPAIDSIDEPAPVVQEDPPASEEEYGDGMRINEQGEKMLEFGTLNKKRKSVKKVSDDA